MRGRLKINYRRDGRELSAGSIIELDDDDRAILGDRVELLVDDAAARADSSAELPGEHAAEDALLILERLDRLEDRIVSMFEPLGELVADLIGNRAGVERPSSDAPAGPGVAGDEARTGRAAGEMRLMAAADPERKTPGWWLANGYPAIDEMARRGVQLTADERDALWPEVVAAGLDSGARSEDG